MKFKKDTTEPDFPSTVDIDFPSTVDAEAVEELIPEKLGFFQRQALKRVLKKAKRSIDKTSKDATETENWRQQNIKAITQLLEIVEVEHHKHPGHEDGTPVTAETVKTLSYSDTNQLLKDIIDHARKIV